MKSRFLLFVFVTLMGFSLIMGQISTAAAQSQSSNKSKSSSQNDRTQKKTMDERKKEKADKIISDMTDRGASQSDIHTQKKANKKYYGHEGE
jgi:hypothetical protein